MKSTRRKWFELGTYEIRTTEERAYIFKRSKFLLVTQTLITLLQGFLICSLYEPLLLLDTFRKLGFLVVLGLIEGFRIIPRVMIEEFPEFPPYWRDLWSSWVLVNTEKTLEEASEWVFEQKQQARREKEARKIRSTYRL